MLRRDKEQLRTDKFGDLHYKTEKLLQVLSSS